MIQESASFNDNLKLFSRFLPQNFHSIPESNVSNYEFVKTKANELNLVQHTAESDIYYHSPYGALREAELSIQHIDLNKTNTLVIFGVGLGYHFDALKTWLKASPDRSLIFVEDDRSLLKCFLNSYKAEEILTNRQISFVCLGGEGKIKNWLETARPFLIQVSKDWKYAALPAYARFRESESKELYKHLIYYIYILLAANRAYEIQQIEDVNFYWNLLEAVDSFSTKNLREKMPQAPFLICGAGPSLKKERQTLSDIRNQAIIMGAGTGINVLNSLAIEPDFSVAMDSSEVEAARIKAAASWMSPLLTTPYVAQDGLKNWHGPKLFILQAHDLQWRKEFLEDFGFQDEITIETPVTATFFATSIALALDARSLVYLGVDLSFMGGERYGLDKNLLGTSTHHLNREATAAISTDGREILSTHDFLMESQLLAMLALENKDKRFFYASCDGLGIANMPRVKLDHWQEMENLSMHDVMNEVHSAIFSQPKLPLTYKQIEKKLSDWLKTLDKASALFRCDAQIISGPLSALLGFYAKLYDDRVDAEIRYIKAMQEQKGPKETEQQLQLIVEKKKKLLEFLINSHLNEVRAVLKEIQLRKMKPVANPPKVELEPFGIEFDSSLQEIHSDTPPETGIWMRLHADGSLKSQQSYQNKMLHGLSRFFNPIGSLLAEGTFKMGLRVGFNRQYYASGALYSLQKWVEGKKQGLQKYFYENGALKAELPYHNGLLEGTVHLYYPNENIKYEAEFREGMRSGWTKKFSFCGKIEEESAYLEGRLHGCTRIFYPDGKLHFERKYDGEGNYNEYEWSLEGKLLAERKGLTRDFEDEMARLKSSIARQLKELV